VRQGKLVAYIHYTDTSSTAFGFFGPGRPSIEVGIDPSRRAEAGYLQGLVTQAYFSLMRQAMMNPGSLGPTIQEQIGAIDSSSNIDEDQRRLLTNFLGSLDTFLTVVESEESTDSTAALDNSPFGDVDIEFKDVAVERSGPRSSWEITFPQSLQWALIGVAAAFAISMVVERRQGTYLRLRLAPIGRMHILLGKGLATFLACVSSSVLLLGIGVLIFGVRVTSPGGLLVAVLSAAFCFVGIMMFISVLGKTEQAVGGAGWAILLVMSMTGGGMVPVMVMPSWMVTVSHISPVKWSIIAMEGAIWRGFGPAEMALPIAVLLGVGLVGFVVGALVLSRTDS
jgi:ABC-2 type transport system permease protein